VNDFESENDLYQNSSRIPLRSGARVSLRVPAELAVELSGYRPAVGKAQLGARRSLSRLREQLKPPNGGVFLGLNGIVIRSPGGSDAEVFADAIKLGYELVLQELYSEIKQTIASAVRRRGQKRRTLWRGVTTRLGQP
jgi:hypothetical protein